MRNDKTPLKFSIGELITDGGGRAGVVTFRGRASVGVSPRPMPGRPQEWHLARRRHYLPADELPSWRVAVADWTEVLIDGHVEEERFLWETHGADGRWLVRHTRPASTPAEGPSAPVETAPELRGTYTRWTRERNGRALSADILSDVEVIVDVPNGRVITNIPWRPMRPDEARMIGVRLIEAAALADGERTVRDRT